MMKKIFKTTITTANPIIQGHSVYGQPLLPGLAYIDMLYQLAQDGLGLDFREHCLKRLSIFNPLTVRDGRPVRLSFCFEKASNYWKINVSGTETDSMGNPGQKKLYVSAELHEETVVFDGRINIEAIRQEAIRSIDIEKVYCEARRHGLVHQGRIKAGGNIYPTVSGCYIELNATDDDHPNAPDFLFHPAIIDGAAVAMGALEDNRDTGNITAEVSAGGSNDGNVMYLPLYYDSFCGTEPLSAHCFARVNRSSIRVVNEIHMADISFFNDAGKQIAQLNGLTSKRVRYQGQINPDLPRETVQYSIPPADPKSPANPHGPENPAGSNPAEAYIINTLLEIFAKHLGRKSVQIDLNSGFYELGLESSQLLTILQDIERAFNMSLSPVLLFEYLTIAELAAYFTENHTPAQLGPASEMLEIAAPEMGRRYPAHNHDPASGKGFGEPIAIIGLNGRFPKANNREEFWKNLKAGIDCITEIPGERWPLEGFFHPDPEEAVAQGKSYSKWGGFLEGFANFDPLFFNISPREAQNMDPQERLFIQSCWAVMEDAGYTKEQITTRFHGRIGVFAGISKTGFDLWGPEFWKRGEPILPYTSFGSVANRISYLLNLQGPSMAIDTMCSSSLTAIHEACRHLHDGSCDMAIAGGVNLYLHPVNYIMHCAKQMISKTNHCSAFGDGDGFVPGEGAGCVLLKPLSRAEQDGDHIYAVILGSHMNHNGKTNGYLTPNLNAQRNLILENCQNCGVDPRTISYVESAANGSKLGDPIEVEALTKAFSRWTKDKQYCAIGSVKSNIGHTEAASGIAQVTKVILQFQHQQFVPSIHAEPLNPNLDFTNTHFYLQREPGEWKRPVLNLDGKEHEFPRRAMINSFAAGGVNVNLILEEYISAPEIIINPGPAAAQRIIVFSARNPEQLQAVIQQMLEFVIHHPELSLADFAYTLQVGREAMASRLAVVIKNREELIRLLKAYLNRAGDGNQTGTGFTRAREALYTGNLENDDARMRDLLSGKIEETIIEQLLKENDFEKIACYWAQGGRIPWELFYKEEKARRISLPTYPFAGERYWFPASRREHRRESSVPPSTGFQPEEGEKFAIHTGKSTIENIRNYIGNVLVKELKIPAAEIKFNKSLLDYGVDSIASLRLIHDLKEKYRLKLTGREILEFPTIESFAQYLADMVDANGNQTAEVKPEAQWPAAEENGKYPLTAAQMGIWVTQKFSPQNSAYNVPIAVRIRHGLKPDLFKKACEFILKQYPILNTMILEENVLEANGAPYQTIHSTRELDFTQENIAHLDETEIIPYLRKKVKIPFELATSSLMRVYLFSRSAQDYIVLIVIHHIIFDGTSLVLLTKSLWNAYYEYSQNREPEILPLQASFADFVAWEREMLNGPEGEEHLAYWKKQLSGTLHPVTIPADHPRLPVPSHIGATYEARLSEELTRKMRELAKSRQVSLAALFLGIYKVFLYKYTGQSDIFVSLPVIGRPQRRFDSVVGMFINLVVIRSELQPGQSFADFLKELRLRLIDGVNHGDYPFQAIVKYMKENHNMDITGLIQVDFTYQSFIRPNSFDDSHFPPGILAFESLEGIHQEGTDEFGLEIIEAEHNSHFNFKYNPDLFDEATIERMVRHFLNILGQIAANPEIIIAEAELLSREEKARLLVEFNDTRADYPKDKTINELFEEQVSKTPDQTAVMFQDQVLSYRFVNEQSNRLAGILRGKGVKSDTVVGIMVERSVEMMIGLMAIFKAGGAYLPVDPGYPTDRINYMLEDGGVSILLIQQKFAPLEITDRVNRIYIDDPSLFTGRETSGVNLPPANTARSLAYVIYTSGSTGKPKGVMIDHYSLVNRLHWMQKNYPVGADDLILQKTPYTFDVSLWELFWWAVAGARVCFLRPGGEKDPAAIVTAIAEYQVTTIHFVPSMLNAFLGYIESLDDITRLKSLKQVFASGEALNIQQVTKFNRLFHQKSGAKLHNLYGPTEATVDVSYFDCSASQAPEVVPIGKPVDNIRLYILNRDNQLQPVGVPGELHIAGDGLARGYLNRPELTEEKFIPDPFEPGSRLYKTGDLARWLPDGNIEFLGRMDSQIKIRGFRIELGEIENQLALIKTIKDAAVIVKKMMKVFHSWSPILSAMKKRLIFKLSRQP